MQILNMTVGMPTNFLGSTALEFRLLQQGRRLHRAGAGRVWTGWNVTPGRPFVRGAGAPSLWTILEPGKQHGQEHVYVEHVLSKHCAYKIEPDASQN